MSGEGDEEGGVGPRGSAQDYQVLTAILFRTRRKTGDLRFDRVSSGGEQGIVF